MVAFWNPGLITAPPGGVCSSTRHSARYMVTPTNATIAGRKRAIFCSRIVQPSWYSIGVSVSMPGVGRATRLVTPIPHSGSRTSSSCVIGSGTTPPA
jgi:hypothetical protein